MVHSGGMLVNGDESDFATTTLLPGLTRIFLTTPHLPLDQLLDLTMGGLQIIPLPGWTHNFLTNPNIPLGRLKGRPSDGQLQINQPAGQTQKSLIMSSLYYESANN